MKKLFTIAIILVYSISTNTLFSQDTIVAWTFPTGTAADSFPSISNIYNQNVYIRTEGGTGILDFSKNGFTSKSVQTTGWDNGTNLKCWIIEVNTTGYSNITVSSRQQSGGNNPGPRNYKLQYRVGNTGLWSNITGGDIITANDWTTSFVNSISLPSECNDNPSIFIRWIVTSDTNSAGGILTSNGVNKIDEIYINGVINSTNFNENISYQAKLYPNPVKDILFIDNLKYSGIEILNSFGQILLYQELEKGKNKIEISTLRKGLYFVILKNSQEKIINKIAIQ